MVIKRRFDQVQPRMTNLKAVKRNGCRERCLLGPRLLAVLDLKPDLQYAAASGLAVLIVSHQRKSTGEFGEAVRGSNALTGGVDIVLELERPSPSLALGKQARALRAVSRFTSTPDEVYVELDEDTAAFVMIDSPEEVKAASEQTRILEVLIGLGDAARSGQACRGSRVTREHGATASERSSRPRACAPNRGGEAR